MSDVSSSFRSPNNNKKREKEKKPIVFHVSWNGDLLCLYNTKIRPTLTTDFYVFLLSDTGKRRERVFCSVFQEVKSIDIVRLFIRSVTINKHKCYQRSAKMNLNLRLGCSNFEPGRYIEVFLFFTFFFRFSC